MLPKKGSKEIMDVKKRKKRLPMKQNLLCGEENAAKKKRKLDGNVEKGYSATTGKQKEAKFDSVPGSAKPALAQLKAEARPKETISPKPAPASRQQVESKPKAAAKWREAAKPAPLEETKAGGVKRTMESKTMDYKLYRLKKMKEKWKNAETKRRRERKAEKKVEAKKPSEPKSPSEKALSKSAPKKFGTCDFSELLRYWNEYAASSLTGVEREELSLKPNFLFLNKKGQRPHRFFSKRIPDWKEWTEKEVPNGTPQIIILCPSDVRAVELNRDLARFKGEKCRTAKLIPKEKVKGQAEALKRKIVHLAVGTPHRIGLLISHGSLKLDECRVIALDWSFKDPKQRRLITIPELRDAVLQLFRNYFIPLLKSRGEVALFML